MTVGKIYCAKLIYENYKFMRRKGQVQARVSQGTGSELCGTNTNKRADCHLYDVSLR